MCIDLVKISSGHVFGLKLGPKSQICKSYKAKSVIKCQSVKTAI
jgi:hypothetical protein